MREHGPDRVIIEWINDGPRTAPDWLVHSTLAYVLARPRHRPFLTWGSVTGAPALRRPAALALRFVIILALVALTSAMLGIYIGSREPVVVPPAPTPSATAPWPAAFVCPPGSEPDLPGPTDQPRPQPLDGQVVVDRQSGLLVLYRQAENDIWHFDLCTNAWRRSAVVLPHEVIADAAVYDAESDLVVIFGTTEVVVYDADSAEVEVAERPAQSDRTRAVYDPVSDLIYVLDGGQMRTYDVDRDAWREVAQTGDLPPATNESLLMAYDASVRRIVLYRAFGGGGYMYEFDPTTSAWTRQANGAPPMGFFFGDLVAGGEIAYDEASARTIIFTRGRVIAYDATAHVWAVAFDSPMASDAQVEAGDPSHRRGAALAYDPVGERTLAIGGSRQVEAEWVDADDVIAFDLRARAWTVLLEQSVD